MPYRLRIYALLFEDLWLILGGFMPYSLCSYALVFGVGCYALCFECPLRISTLPCGEFWACWIIYALFRGPLLQNDKAYIPQ